MSLLAECGMLPIRDDNYTSEHYLPRNAPEHTLELQVT